MVKGGKSGLKKEAIPKVFVHENLITESAQNINSTKVSNLQHHTEIFRRELFREDVSFKIFYKMNIFVYLIIMKQNKC